MLKLLASASGSPPGHFLILSTNPDSFPLRSVNIVDDDINLNQIKRNEEDDERYAPKEELPTVVGSKEAAKLKAGSWKAVERTRQSSESDEDYDLSALRKNKRASRKDSEDSDLDVRRKRKEDSDSDLEVQRRRKREDSDVEVPRRRKKLDDSDSDVDVKRRRRDHDSPEARNGSRFHREDRPRDHPKDSQSSKHWSRESAKDSNSFRYERHESKRALDDDRRKDDRQRGERRYEDKSRSDKQRDERHVESRRQQGVKKEPEDHRESRKEHKKSRKSKSRSKSADTDARKRRKSKERKSRSSSRSRSKSVEIKKERKSVSMHREHRQPEKSFSKASKQEERSKHKKLKSEDTEKSDKGQRKAKHDKEKSSKERSPKVKKINEISDSDEEDIRVKIANLYKVEADGVSKEDEELDAKHKRWGKGLKQIEEKQKRLAEEEYEMSKPLARYKDDEDLDAHLREQELVDDPMLEYFRQRKKENDHRQQFEETGEIWAIPKYECKVPPPANRFNIWPGYRWDGVDRSNHWEQKILAKKAEKNAAQEEAYKYSSIDM